MLVQWESCVQVTDWKSLQRSRLLPTRRTGTAGQNNHYGAVRRRARDAAAVTVPNHGDLGLGGSAGALQVASASDRAGLT